MSVHMRCGQFPRLSDHDAVAHRELSSSFAAVREFMDRDVMGDMTFGIFWLRSFMGPWLSPPSWQRPLLVGRLLVLWLLIEESLPG